ncbi:hypothetical protein R2325_07730 [Mycobacteroides chelonae]|uniref:hypothetical protein n=1 Tax=Mycobacteroides chelonae TaxID=1774 RepID=UPI0009C15C9A|nr:hypothetical protein [Mycobacteroides chelonae]AYM44104.1 hypothetical protein DYE20_23520 [[Mycobacterium] chelonae subsp. gwanakae]MEC4855581.1 hypothetical protein [Mycobacteroides chelonae]MEC4872011.1 hypothetical protein [Mycobacteroides chelonae]
MTTTISTSVRATEARVRRLADRKGYVLRKGRSKDTAGLYVLLDDCNHTADFARGPLPDAAAAFARGEGDTLASIEARLAPMEEAFRPYAGRPEDEQVRCGPLPYISARTGTAWRRPTLLVHRSLVDEALPYYEPVEDFLSRHRHEVVSGPTRIRGEDDLEMFGPSEITMYLLLDYDEAS